MLNQLVVEHVLSESRLDPSTVNTPPAAPSGAVAASDARNGVTLACERQSDPDVVCSTEPQPVPAVPASTPPASGPVLSDRLDATPPAPKELPSPLPAQLS